MNNMKDKAKSKSGNKNLRKLSISIGDFIRYWGFRRVHGAIWTQLYLSKTPLSCTDLTDGLGLSKALISPALDELCKYKLIREAPSPNEKTRLYEAVENVGEVIGHVLKTREAKMLEQINQHFAEFEEAGIENSEISSARAQELSRMIISANMMMELMLGQKDLLKLPLELKA